jgi:hypothetical protein
MSPERPAVRRLRVFALDPGMTAQMETTVINEVVLPIPWEELEPGPVGEYVAVVDQDEAGRQVFAPVDLDDPLVLAGDGLPPSDGNPQFRQQMVYAVAMRTIGTFEKALGRQAHWPQVGKGYKGRIELYPHFLNVANSWYQPDKGALYFGYTEALAGSQFPGMIVFTCLSQDVIAHELAHALLNGMHLQFIEDTNPDVLAFHEAFCDLVALLQRFSLPDVLRHQLALARGDLTARSQLGILAQQFGEAVGMKGGLRSALGKYGEDGVWRPRTPNPKDYRTLKMPHERGDLLVAAVFDAFNKIYQSRVADLIRISTEGTGVLPEGELHPDLVNRMALEAAKSASHVLGMCVRALDYCPSVDIDFGDYLRAIITADFDLVPKDDRNYRVAFVEAFRRYGIFPASIGTLSIETLLWPKPASAPAAEVVKEFALSALAKDYTVWAFPHDREELYKLMKKKAKQLEEDLNARGKALQGLLGEIDTGKPFEVQSIWPRQHTGPSGQPLSRWVIEIVQREGSSDQPDFRLAGCTLLVDADTGGVLHAIHKAAGGPERRRQPQDLLARSSAVPFLPPAERMLRVFAFDPSMATQMETARINEATLSIPWERLDPGPVGEYLEVVDYDPASTCFYDPVDLNNKYLIAEDGHAPSQGNPQFHQQMVYAVAMRTIRNFERVLGRLALWDGHGHSVQGADGQPGYDVDYVPRLRLYPHGLREANAFYSPDKQAVLFGYFQRPVSRDASPLTVFSCLSHDIIAHEVTHALLDGMHRRFREPSNPDVLAFHEAFADLVALFQHFSLPEVLEHQIAATRGDLASQNRLGELAQEFGSAIGNRGALRSAIGEYDKDTGQWRPLTPDPEAYVREMEPHTRGALLVATVFDAFLTIYRSRVADLFRIATKGSGVLPAGQLHPDLVRRLATEAAKSAQTVLEICIRALDYCPPVDLTFGDYLRAIITADWEYDPVDEDNRRVAFIEAFRRHGILPGDVRALSLEGLLWKQVKAAPDEDEKVVIDFVRDWTKSIKSWSLSSDRKELFEMMKSRRAALHKFLAKRAAAGELSFIDRRYPFEIHSLRPSSRVDSKGKSHFQWIIEVTQRTPEFLDPDDSSVQNAVPDYYFRGGATLLVDAESGRLRYSIPKSLNDQGRRDRQRQYMTDVANRSLYATYFRDLSDQEPFAALHRF